jgi:hypothetical protein
MRFFSAALVAGAILASTAPFPAAQNPASARFVGTIREFSAGTAEVLIQPDGAETTRVKVTPETVVQRVAPGEKDLRNAKAIPVTELLVGDRVYVTVNPGASEARRILVMSTAEIARKNEGDRQDWLARGVAGIVTAKIANSITLRSPSMGSEHITTVRIDSGTAIRRYAPDSVKFSDARLSTLAEISTGDQMRARGVKSEDGKSLHAEEVVFGTFETRAGSIASVDVAAREITINEMGTNQRLTIRVTGDSQVKAMPDFGAMMGGGPPGPMPGGPPGGPGPGGAGRPDFSQMLEHMPAASIDELKPGSTIVVSSTKGQTEGKITAIMLLANADRLIKMASVRSGQGRTAGRGASAGLDMNGMSGLGFDMTGMMP